MFNADFSVGFMGNSAKNLNNPMNLKFTSDIKYKISAICLMQAKNLKFTQLNNKIRYFLDLQCF